MLAVATPTGDPPLVESPGIAVVKTNTTATHVRRALRVRRVVTPELETLVYTLCRLPTEKYQDCHSILAFVCDTFQSGLINATFPSGLISAASP